MLLYPSTLIVNLHLHLRGMVCILLLVPPFSRPWDPFLRVLLFRLGGIGKWFGHGFQGFRRVRLGRLVIRFRAGCGKSIRNRVLVEGIRK